jgi:hypothetical protein
MPNSHLLGSNVGNIAKWTVPTAIIIFSASVQCAWSDQGLMGDVRKTFVEATIRSCLQTQLNASGNKSVPVSVIQDYCKCSANGLADKISVDEVKTLEAAGNAEKSRTVMQSRLEGIAKICLEAAKKSLSK